MRIIKEIEIEGKKAVALFDSGAFHSYVKTGLLKGAPLRKIPVVPYRVAIGGREIRVKEHYAVWGKIDGYAFSTYVTRTTSLGKIDGKKLDAIIGAETMEAWEITLDPRKGTLGLEGLKRKEFTEY